jgi:hypothetical protein
LNPSAVGTVLDHKLVWRVAQGIGEAQSTQDSPKIKNSITLSLGMFCRCLLCKVRRLKSKCAGYVASHVCAANKAQRLKCLSQSKGIKAMSSELLCAATDHDQKVLESK